MQIINKLKQISKEPEKVEKKINGKQYLLGKYYDGKKMNHKASKKTPKSKIKRLLQIQQGLSTVQRGYEFYLPLHTLWCSYTCDLVKNDKSEESINLKILRSDFHGAEICVVESKIDSYIGLEGLVINETMKTFKIITKKGRLLQLLKSQIVFTVNINEKFYLINGNCLLFRSTDRAKHKFKARIAHTMNMKLMDFFLKDD